MTIQEMVTLNLTPVVELTEEDIRLLLQNKPALREVKHSSLFKLAVLHLQLKQDVEGIYVPTRETVEEVVAKASDYLASACDYRASA